MVMSKMFRAAVICSVVALALSAMGCSRGIMYSRSKELMAVQDTLGTEMAAALAALQDKFMEEHGRMLEEQKTASEMLRLLRADQVVRFNQIDSKVSAIERSLHENQARLSALDQRTTEVNRRLERRMAAEEDAESQRQQQIQNLFNIAMGDFNAGRYDLAISGFADIATQYPETPQALDAEYWVAEAHFAKKDYPGAEKLYFDFVKKYPEGSKMCASFFKLGLAYERQEKVRSRDMVWNNLLERCPDTQEAEAVKEQKGGR